MDNFTYREVKRYVKLVEQSNVSELEIVLDGRTLRIKKEFSTFPQFTQHPAPASAAPLPPADSQIPETVREPQPASVITEIKGKLIEVKAPMVGTLYHSPAPEAKPYVEAGDLVSAGKVLCVIEAMKLMNEIECEISGRIAEICVESGQPVEYGSILFRIEPS